MRYFCLTLALLLLPVQTHPQTPQMPPGVSRAALLDNAAVSMARLTFEPEAREQLHTHPFSAIVIQLTPGEVEMVLGAEKTSAKRAPFFTWFIPKESPHAAVNVGGTACQFVTIAIKPAARTAVTGPLPSSPAPAGITRTMVLENVETRVAQVSFDPGAREEVHTHAFDLVLVQLTEGRVEVLIGADKTVGEHPAGDVLFLPREVPHAIANAGGRAFEIMSVAIK